MLKPNECSLKSHRAIHTRAGGYRKEQRETCYFYLVLFRMGLLYLKFIKVFISLNWLLSLKNDVQIALNKSTKISNFFKQQTTLKLGLKWYNMFHDQEHIGYSAQSTKTLA